MENTTNNTVKFTASDGKEVTMVFSNENCDKIVEHVKNSILNLYEKRIRNENYELLPPIETATPTEHEYVPNLNNVQQQAV